MAGGFQRRSARSGLKNPYSHRSGEALAWISGYIEGKAKPLRSFKDERWTANVLNRPKSLLLAAMDRYEKRFDWFVPDILERVMAEVDGLTRELLAASTELLQAQRRRLFS